MAAESGITIAFANMDWNQGRRDGRHWNRHHAKWKETTAAMLRNFEPDVLCFCVVGRDITPLTEEHFTVLKNITSEVWFSFGIEKKVHQVLAHPRPAVPHGLPHGPGHMPTTCNDDAFV